MIDFKYVNSKTYTTAFHYVNMNNAFISNK